MPQEGHYYVSDKMAMRRQALQNVLAHLGHILGYSAVFSHLKHIIYDDFHSISRTACISFSFIIYEKQSHNYPKTF